MTPPLTAYTIAFGLLPFGTMAAETDWQGVWMTEGYDCPTPTQIETMENGPLDQGPDWQFFEVATCEALHGRALDDTNALEVTGLCRGVGTLESKSWRFELIDADRARVTDLMERAVELKRCPQ